MGDVIGSVPPRATATPGTTSLRSTDGEPGSVSKSSPHGLVGRREMAPGEMVPGGHGMPLLSITGVSKSWGWGPSAFTAVRDVDLDVAEGEFIALIGPSGCGKSTLLDMVAGLIFPTTGQVVLNGAPVRGPHPSVGFVFQQDATFPWLTALRNVEFGLEQLSLGRAERRERAMAMLSLVGLQDFASHYPHQLSGGMRQRVNIARVLAARPKIVLMDEPFGALDEQTRLRLGDELLRIWRETSSTILFVTHSLSEAALLSDRVVVMGVRPGRILDIVSSPLGRDRSSDLVGSGEYAAVQGALWRLLSH